MGRGEAGQGGIRYTRRGAGQKWEVVILVGLSGAEQGRVGLSGTELDGAGLSRGEWGSAR